MPWNQPPKHFVSSRAKANAKALRRQMTEPEKRLWWHLRHRLPVEGSHFRRQVAIGNYIVDFCCLPARLIIEVDGNQHGFDQALAYDAKRTGYLEAQGFRVLRFGNHEMMREIDSELAVSRLSSDAHAGAPSPFLDSPTVPTPTPDPSPQGGGELEA